MLTKILSATLLIMLAGMVWMGISHRSDLDSLNKQVEKAAAELAAANRDMGAATTRAINAEGVNRSNAAQIAILNSDLTLQRQLAEQQASRADDIQDHFDKLNRRYQEALQDDPQTRDWASAPLPAAVVSGSLLYHPAAQAGGRDADAVPAGAGAAASAAPVPVQRDAADIER